METDSTESDGSNNRQKNTMDKLYLERDETGDVTFIVDSEKIRAHKSVLAASSPKYKTQFYGLQPDQGDIVVEDVTTGEFKEFLQFFYVEEPELTTENIAGVLSLAKQSLVEHFVEDCVKFLSTGVENTCLVYRLSLLYDIEELLEVCHRYISESTMEVFKSDSFLVNCDRDMLLQILKMDSLNCTETEVFDASISWAKAVCISKNLDAENMENLRAELGDTINEVRFRSMTIEEFVHLHSLHQGFFTQHEMQEIIYMIGKLKDFQPSKFNQALRNDELRVLELNRVICEEDGTMKSWFLTVSFECSKGIRLKGFATGFKFLHNVHPLQLTTADENGFLVYELKYTIRQRNETLGEPPHNQTIVMFEEPIDIQPNRRVSIYLGIPVIEIEKKYTLSMEIELDGCKFRFNPLNLDEGMLLTRLFFNKIK